MEQTDYRALKNFFKSFTLEFLTHAADPEPFRIKIVHTENVCKNTKILAQDLGRTDAEIRKAMAAALLHDIGRFPQYFKYSTFSDARSVNHGALGVKVIKNQGLLLDFKKKEKQQILTAVALHNAFSLPACLDSETLELAKLIRDADKLDILRVMIELYKGTIAGRTSFITHHLPDDGQVSLHLIEQIENRQLVDIRNVKTLNDMKLLQISWIFDLNFPVSLRLFKQRNFPASILSTMPQSSKLDRAAKAADDYLNRF